MDDLTWRLRETAATHHVDRARMLARIETGMARPMASPRGSRGARHRERALAASWTRVALTALAAIGVLTAGSLAVAAIAQGPRPQQDPAVIGTASSSSASPSAVATPAPVRPSTAPATRRSSSLPPSGALTSPDGPLSADGTIDPHSNAFWSQSNLVLQTAEPLTALALELRIARAGGVSNTGTWQTLPGDDFTVDTREDNSALVYRWTLKPGRTVPAGRHTFAAQYNHATGARTAKDDSYRADAVAGSHSTSVRGGFSPAG